MPEVIAKLRYLRISPKKVRPLAKILKGLPLTQAEAYLKHFHKQASSPLLKLLHSAAANAEHNFRASKSDLYVRNVLVDPGPTLKRWLPRAFGQVSPISKRTSHITLILDSRRKMVKEKLPIIESPPKKEMIFAEPQKVVEKPGKRPEEGTAKGKEGITRKFRLPKPKLPAIKGRFFRRKAV